MKTDNILISLFVASLLFCYTQMTKEHDFQNEINYKEIDSYWHEQNYKMKEGELNE